MLYYILVQLLRCEMHLLEPTVEVPNQPKLDPAMDPRKALRCQTWLLEDRRAQPGGPAVDDVWCKSA
jgi:hypothetical protein